jgi:hypothetical protein
MFSPEQWGSLEKFSHFYSSTHELKSVGKKAVSGAVNHFRKALTLRDLALKMVPNLDLDDKELNEAGFSSAVNSRELSAIIESVILELYSSLDCSRKVVTEIYSGHRGIPDSTRKFFQNISEKEIDDRFPEELIEYTKEANSWYVGFRKIRDELTHSDIGTCHKDKTSGIIRYMHSGFNINGRALVIDDIFEKIEQSISEVNTYIGKVFNYLYSQLNDDPVHLVCGVFNSRVYMRHVTPHEAKDFHSGVCQSHSWFELDENPTCILADKCGAYKKC